MVSAVNLVDLSKICTNKSQRQTLPRCSMSSTQFATTCTFNQRACEMTASTFEPVLDSQANFVDDLFEFLAVFAPRSRGSLFVQSATGHQWSGISMV